MKIFFLMILISTSAFARWATRADLPYVVLNDESNIIVKKDGTFSITQTMEFELLNEQAKEKFSLYSIPFNSSFNKVTILEANVTNLSSVHQYAKDKVVERSVSKDNGISDAKIMQIPLTNVQVGSKILIKFRMDYTTAIVPGHFSSTFSIGEFNQADNASIKIDSEVPLHVLENDPFNVMTVTEKKLGTMFNYQAYLNEPYLKLPVQEVGSLPLTKFTFLRFSTDKDWTKISTNMKSRFEKILSQPLPKEFDHLIQELHKIQKLEDKVNYLLSHVTQKYNYLGDWRTVNGGFSPRNLEEIATTKFGDCKDFSVITTRILRELKINADVALVLRGPAPQARLMSYELPSMDLFNHAIVRIEDKGKTYWIDPTNKYSYGLNHRADISGRPVLGLTGKHALEKIPLNSPEESFINVDKTITYESETSGQVKGEMTFAGMYSLIFNELSVTLDSAKMDEAYLKFFSDGEKPIVPDISGHKTESRLYSRLNLKFDYSASDLSEEDGGKHSGVLPGVSPFLQVLAHDTEKWEGDLYLGEEQSMKKTVTIKGIFAARRPHGCSISNDWLDYKRSYEFLSDGLKVTESYHYKAEFIPQEKFKSTDFKILQANLFRCAGENHVSFKWGDKKHAESEEEVDKKFVKLPLKERIQARINFVRDVRDEKIDAGFSDEDLIYFLKKNVKDDPTHYPSYRIWANIVLMAGYYNGNNFNKANIQEAKDIISEGLHHIHNNTNLLVELVKLRLYDGETANILSEANRLQSKEEINDIHTIISLSKIYDDMGDPQNSLALLGKALKLAKTDSEKETVWFRLANTYSGANEHEKCIGAYKQVFKIDPKDSFSLINVVGCYIRAKRYDEAVAQAKLGLKSLNSGLMRHWTSEALVNRAYDFAKRNKLAEAEKDYKESIHYTKQSEAYSGLAWIAIQKKDYDKAVSLVKEGVQYHEGNKNQYIKDIAMYLLKLSPEHFKKLTGQAIDQAQSVAETLWGIYSISYSLHKEKKREEMYKNVEKGIAIGEQVLQSGKIEGEVAAALGSLYAIYGIDADNVTLLNKANFILGMAKGLIPNDDRVNKNIGEVNRILENIKNGRVPAAELNYNRKFANLKYGMKDDPAAGTYMVIGR